jgi:hypothetical protein
MLFASNAGWLSIRRIASKLAPTGSSSYASLTGITVSAEHRKAA